MIASTLHTFFDRLDSVGWFVFLLLVGFGLTTCYIIGARIWYDYREQRAESLFRSAFSRCQGVDDFTLLVDSPSIPINPFTRIGKAALAVATQGGSFHPEQFYRALQNQLDREVANLEWGLTFLATSASVTPYIGLLGTVWNIYHALMAIAAQSETTLAAVSAPMGEALLMTALGLTVAIPAAIGYNSATRRNRLHLSELEAFAYECYFFLAFKNKA